MLCYYRLAGERRLVYLKVGRLNKISVGRYFVAYFYYDDITNNNILTCHLNHLAVAAHLYGRLLAESRKHIKLFCRVHLKVKSNGGGKDNGKDNAYRLNVVVLDDGKSERYNRCKK